jgi:hypothetical protein
MVMLSPSTSRVFPTICFKSRRAPSILRCRFAEGRMAQVRNGHFGSESSCPNLQIDGRRPEASRRRAFEFQENVCWHQSCPRCYRLLKGGKMRWFNGLFSRKFRYDESTDSVDQRSRGADQYAGLPGLCRFDSSGGAGFQVEGPSS